MSHIKFSAEYRKMQEYVYSANELAVPDMLDDLPRSIEHALCLGRRYLEYAELARRKLAEAQGVAP